MTYQGPTIQPHLHPGTPTWVRTRLDDGSHCTAQSDRRKFGEAEAREFSGKSRTFEKNINHWTVLVVAYDLRT